MDMSNIFSEIDLIVFDFDGVLTNNQVLVFADGREAVFVNRSDGLAITRLIKYGYRMIIISTETNNVVKARAEKLRIPVISGVEDKKQILIDYCNRNQFDLEKTIFVGNDINDREVMMTVGIPICPNDAYPIIKNISKVILKSNGGFGVVRELMDLILLNHE
ncbi:MAG: HAD hydrolase family protein [Saprospiraceae bacterium]|nr:HAD hydrolase family protein [Saprospiraceae bacterium]